MIDKRPSYQNAIEKNGAYVHAKTLAIYAFLILPCLAQNFLFFHIFTHLYKSFFLIITKFCLATYICIAKRAL